MSRIDELQQKIRNLLPLLVISLSGVAILPVSNPANAQTPLTKAVIQDLRNLVQLMPQRQPRRRAQRSDSMIPGDGLSTGRLSLADLRFNDGSMARVGEQAVFQFLPQTRNFTLNRGTVLLLIPPRQGQTNIRTPNAAAAIRGSALFVRYDKVTDTTVIGALTNSGIEVFNKDGSNSQVISAGQMMVVVKGKFQGLYEFDLRTFYDTSDLVRGLDLTRQNPNAVSDPALNSVRAETSEALTKQSPISGSDTIKDPSFIKLSPTTEETVDTALFREGGNVDNVLTTSEVQSDTNLRNNRNNSSSHSEQSTSTQPVRNVESNVGVTITPPKTDKESITPVVNTPVTPPVVNNPVTPPVVNTPVTPPVVNTPVTPPVVNTPVTPPVVNTPVTPPVVNTPVTPPVVNTPVTPPVINTPVTPPVINTPVTPPVINTPVTPPVVNTPVTPPVVNTPVTPPVVNTPVTPPVVNTPVTPPVVNTPVTPIRPPSDATKDPSTRPST